MTSEDQLDPALQTWSTTARPHLLDVHIDPSQYHDVLNHIRGARF